MKKEDLLVNCESLFQPNWQFNVIYFPYHVLKMPKSKKQQILAIKQSRWGRLLNDDQIEKLSTEVSDAALESLRIVRGMKNIRGCCGEPFFFSKHVFIQKRGTSFLEQLIKSERNLQEIIHDYFMLNRELWEYGVFETTFDFLRNCGMLSDRRLFFIDLGNFTTDINEALLIISQKRWLTRCDYISLDSNGKNIFDRYSHLYFNSKLLSERWGKKR